MSLLAPARAPSSPTGVGDAWPDIVDELSGTRWRISVKNTFVDLSVCPLPDDPQPEKTKRGSSAPPAIARGLSPRGAASALAGSECPWSATATTTATSESGSSCGFGPSCRWSEVCESCEAFPNEDQFFPFGGLSDDKGTQTEALPGESQPSPYGGLPGDKGAQAGAPLDKALLILSDVLAADNGATVGPLGRRPLVGPHGRSKARHDRALKAPSAGGHGERGGVLAGGAPLSRRKRQSKARGEAAEKAAQLPSIGSAGHSKGSCRPCAHNWRPGGCSKGRDCEFCHTCTKADFMRLRRIKRECREAYKVRSSLENEFNAAAGPSSTNAESRQGAIAP